MGEMAFCFGMLIFLKKILTVTRCMKTETLVWCCITQSRSYLTKDDEDGKKWVPPESFTRQTTKYWVRRVFDETAVCTVSYSVGFILDSSRTCRSFEAFYLTSYALSYFWLLGCGLGKLRGSLLCA